MIVSASYRTDIPAFHARWFQARLAAGEAWVTNPYGGRPSRVSLAAGDVDGWVFWTRNPLPFMDALEAVAARGEPFTVQMTVLGYPRALDTAVIPPDRALPAMAALRDRFGPRAVVWRHDPIVFTDLTPAAWHRERFARHAVALRGVVDEVVLSVMQVYAKTRRGLDARARQHGFAWRDPPDDEKRALLADLAEIGAQEGLRVSLCGQEALRAGLPGVAPAACIDAARLADVAGRQIKARPKPHRTCGCAESRDIGAYDTCPHGCAYCYAVRNVTLAKQRYAAHDPASPFLEKPAPD
ncbi:DUF1848 domain-containing protein [Roseospira marina]|uniref:DUF1848 domain-containing protein n=1 Tax=Roseospira marina TaxID=140057 RepID=A0A5M6IA53_9PROT|nr:DUF1848 domain-containing protein [Roseospira marina]KAA5605154.1 DUF1848 domain-containing protein [Roseospira marina]MBB4314910.1 hypothetical protein [Roseospira marina]MBB5087910.1 hypothetical protein [Roseospira marina]